MVSMDDVNKAIEAAVGKNNEFIIEFFKKAELKLNEMEDMRVSVITELQDSRSRMDARIEEMNALKKSLTEQETLIFSQTTNLNDRATTAAASALEATTQHDDLVLKLNEFAQKQLGDMAKIQSDG